MARGKQRYKCRACNRFFILDREPETRKGRVLAKKNDPLPSAARLMIELQSLARTLKRTPRTADIGRLSKGGKSHSLKTYYAVFGSFVTAVRRSGVKQHYRQQFDESEREFMLDQLRTLSRKLKRPILGKDVMAARKKKLVSPVNHYQLAFGSVPAAIAAAGVAPKVSFTRRELIEILRRLDRGMNRPVQNSDIAKAFREGKGPAMNSFIREFGSLRKARKVASVKDHYEKGGSRTRHWQKYTKPELIKQLRKLGRTLGRKPTDRDINRTSKLGECASSETFSRMFGDLRKAYLAAGFTEESKKHQRYTDKQIIVALRKLTKELGRFPTFHDLEVASLDGKCPSPGTITRRIGRLKEIRDQI